MTPPSDSPDPFSVSRVLLATDGSAGAEAAAAHAVELAARTDATLHVLSVVDDRHADSFSTERMRRRERTRAAVEGEEATATAARRATAAGVHALTAVEEGRPAAVVAEFAADVEADVVVVGTRGRTGVGRFLLGSVAEAVVDAVDAAVLVVPATGERPDPTPDYRRLLLAVDGEGGADRAADAAVSLAAAYGAEVTALSVVDERFARPSALRASLESAARETVRAVAVDAAERGVAVDAVVETGVPAARVLDSEGGFDLVAVGGRRRRGLDAVPLGSVARRVVRRSEVPVLVVRDSEVN
ncbi:universal stress protein [Halogeometricum luteum]|uniref:Universal stress protein n=1 Tax=Halogeometricum luteum TaxID=2950537 RepID=A0ABU2G369_9EURY|nr:universal stress protein [Halogeometricum sp. S3BR5-2]MDS0294748.1 universal stress protein [Halogeometricum sp. S3BR5-2]